MRRNVDRYPARFHAHHQRWLAAKLGLDAVTEADGAFIQSFHELLATEGLDLTLAFRWLAELANDSSTKHRYPSSSQHPQRC